MATQIDVRVDRAAPQKLSGNLGVGSIVFMVVAAAGPLTVIGGGTPVGFLLGNGAGFPLSYAISGLVLLIFSVGLGAIVKAVPKPGAFFTYIGYGLGRPMGVGAAWAALLCYTTVQVAVYAYFGASLNLDVTTLGLPSAPWWVYSMAALAIIGVLGYRAIQLSARVLSVLLIGEVGLSLALAFAIVFQGGAEGLSLVPFTLPAFTSGSPGVGLMMAVAGYIGFESTAVYRDEARDPDRTIPRATFLAVIAIGLLYSFVSWALVMGWGPDKIVDAAAADTTGLILETAMKYLGTVGAVLIQTFLLTSLFACALSFHNVITRYQHAMGGISLLHARVGSVHEKHGSPSFSSLIQSGTAAVVLIFLTAIGWDPVLQIFTWLSGISTIAVLILMALTSVAVVVYFTRRGRAVSSGLWQSRIAPIVAAVGLIVIAGIVIAYFPALVGGGWDLASVLLATVPAALVVGIVQALVIKKRRPADYENIIDSLS
jgi:amino acid transporter